MEEWCYSFMFINLSSIKKVRLYVNCVRAEIMSDIRVRVGKQ